MTGPVRYTMTARGGASSCAASSGRARSCPVHYEGWSHFKAGRAATEREFARAPEDIRSRVRWLPLGEPVELAANGAGRSAAGR